MKKLLIYLVIPFLLAGCVGQVEHEKVLKQNQELKAQIEQLTKELNGYKNDPAKLLQQAQDGLTNEDESALMSACESLKLYHPESNERKQADDLYAQYAVIKRKKIEEQQQAIAKAEKERLAALNRLKKKYDDISGNTWYQNPYFVHYNNSNLTSLYMGENNNSVWLRLVMSYTGEDWIFFKHAYLSYEGNTIEIPFDEYREKKTDNDTEVWEWIDVTVSDSMLSFLRKMVNGKTPKMRLSGKYEKTRNLSTNEIKAIRDVLAGYDTLKANK